MCVVCGCCAGVCLVYCVCSVVWCGFCTELCVDFLCVLVCGDMVLSYR